MLHELLRRFYEGGLTILYGNRGSGKSLLLLQLAEELQDKHKIHLVLTNKRRDVDKLKHFSLERVKTTIIDEENMSESLESIIKLVSESDSFEIVMFDDPLPITVLVERELRWDEARDLGLFMSLLSRLISNHCVILTIQEHSSFPAPRRWKMFEEFDAKYIRIYKKHRIRELYEARLYGLPGYGEFWDKSLRPQIKFRKIASIRLSGLKFSVIEE